MVEAIKVNGVKREVVNVLSSGPTDPPSTYVLRGCYVYNVGKDWMLQVPGQFARVVTVEVA